MTRIQEFAAVGFDFDGTIADTRAAMTSARLDSFKSVAAELGDERYAQVDPAIHAEAHHHGSHAIEIFSWVMLQAGIIQDVVAEQAIAQHVVNRRNEIYWEKAQAGFDALPGAIETIRATHEQLDGQISIVTTAPLVEEVMPYLKRHDLLDLFDPRHIITKHDVPELKPSPRAYQLAMARLAIKPAAFLAMEDAHAGILSARRANVGNVVALATTHSADQLQNFPADEQPTAIVSDHAEFQRRYL